MTHMQIMDGGAWMWVGLAWLIAAAVGLFVWSGRRDDDDQDPPDAPGLWVEEVLFSKPVGFHNPKGAAA